MTDVEARPVENVRRKSPNGLSYNVAKELGVILRRAATSVTNVPVGRCALTTGGSVITSDPTDIRQLIPRKRIKVG